MSKIGIFYSLKSGKTGQQAQSIIKAFGEDKCEVVDIVTAKTADFMKYDFYVMGVSTWFDGELPYHWEEFLPMIEDESFKGKTFAIYGGGNQREYPDNYCDGLGLMAEFVEERGGKVVGFTSTEGYTFDSSHAVRNGKFVGLALDIENQAAQTEERIEKWVKQLKKEFGLK